MYLKFLKCLEDNGKCTVKDISLELEVSERTVKRYKNLAINHGYYIESKRGRYGYYQLIGKTDKKNN